MSKIISVPLMVVMILFLTGCERDGTFEIGDCREVITIEDGAIQTYYKTFTCANKKRDDGKVIEGVCANIERTFFGDECKKAYVYVNKSDIICQSHSTLNKSDGSCVCEDGYVSSREGDRCVVLRLLGSAVEDIETISVEENTDIYAISVKYPRFLDTEVYKNVNNELEKFAKDFIVGFKEDHRGIDSENLINSLAIDFKKQVINEKLISFAFDVIVYGSGAAHPFNFITGFNYDLAQGKVLEIEDIFKNTDKYLEFMSNHTIRDLLVQGYDRNWVQKGADVERNSFKFFTMDADGLIIYFLPYQVAPYAEGVVTVKIPYNAIESGAAQISERIYEFLLAYSS